MTPGTIKELDHDDHHGSIAPDHGGEAIPFDFDGLAEGEDGSKLRVGDHVLYEVEGGLAGIAATHVRRVSRAQGE